MGWLPSGMAAGRGGGGREAEGRGRECVGVGASAGCRRQVHEVEGCWWAESETGLVEGGREVSVKSTPPPPSRSPSLLSLRANRDAVPGARRGCGQAEGGVHAEQAGRGHDVRPDQAKRADWAQAAAAARARFPARPTARRRRAISPARPPSLRTASRPSSNGLRCRPPPSTPSRHARSVWVLAAGSPALASLTGRRPPSPPPSLLHRPPALPSLPLPSTLLPPLPSQSSA